MDANWLLLIFVGIACGAFLANALRMPFRLVRRQVLLSGIVIAGAAGTWLFAPDIAGYVALGLWLALFLGPVLMMRVIQRLMRQRRYSQALVLTRVMRVLQPWGGWGQLPETLVAFQLAHIGRLEEAVGAFQALVSSGGPMAPSARAEIARLTSRWDEFASWVRGLSPHELVQHLNILPSYLRALGELGNVAELLQTLRRFQPALEQPALRLHLLQARLFALVFSGRVQAVERLCDTLLKDTPPSSRQFWVARARLAAGDVERGVRELQALRDCPEADTRAMVTRLLERELPAPYPPGMDEPLLQQIELDLDQAIRYGGLTSARSPKAVITFALLVANVLMFLLEVQQGGSEDEMVLTRIGALVPELVREGEWWRIGEAMFMHLGPLHIGVNMLGLLVLGPFLERAIGRVRFTIVYFVAGLLSMGCIYYVALLRGQNEELAVGASGAIMALVGGTAAVMLEGWRRERARLARQRMRAMVAIIALQAVFDILTPEVSFTGHLSGAIFGFLVTWLLLAFGSRAPAIAASGGRASVGTAG